MDKRLLKPVALVSYLGLMLVIALWELVFVRSHEVSPWFWFALKELPLLAAVLGLVKGRVYTFNWASMLILLYFVNGVMVTVMHRREGFSWHSPLSFGASETVLSLVFFGAALCYMRACRPATAQGHG